MRLQSPWLGVVAGMIAACTDRSAGEAASQGGDGGIGNLDDAADDDEPPDEDPPPEPDGNFPEPALTDCGPLPAGFEPIPGLASAWVAEGSFMGTNEQGVHGPMHGLRLRLSDGGMACDEPFPAATEACTNAWGWAMTLPPPMQAVGAYALSDWGGIYVENAFQATGTEGCADAGGGGGDGGPDPVDIAGSIEILSFDANCVVGRIEGIEIGGSALDDLDGGFVAMRCATDCIPQYLEPACD